MLRFLKSNALFVSMVTGIVFYSPLAWLAPLTKYFLFSMLVITYCKITPRQLKPEPLHFWLACVQIAGSVVVYLTFAPFNKELAEGCFLCILAPTATSAPVFAALLGGSIASLTTYCILSNLSIAFLAPVALSLLGAHGMTEELSFVQTFLTICSKVMPLLLIPFLLATGMRQFTPKIHSVLQNKQTISFWLWVIALAVLLAKTTEEILEMDKKMYPAAIVLALGATIACFLQFATGWYLGQKHGNRIAGGQGLGQKNTILALWMAHTFFNPIVAIAPAFYIISQNMINSYQLWRYRNPKK